MSNIKYLNRFEILHNDGKTLKFHIDELAKWVDNCFVRHLVNKNEQGEANEITISGTLEYAIEESGIL